MICSTYVVFIRSLRTGNCNAMNSSVNFELETKFENKIKYFELVDFEDQFILSFSTVYGRPYAQTSASI